MKLVIFGAQGYALGACEALKTLYPKRVVSCFLVSDMGKNPSELGGIPVKEISSFSAGMTKEEKRNIQILIATPENVQAEIEEILEAYDFKNHCRLDSDRWQELMKMFHARKGDFLPLSALPVGYNNPFMRVFIAKSHKDRPLKSGITLPDYSFPIQAGTDNSDRIIADLCDNMGVNISSKNSNYSELTVLYWMWKNKLRSVGSGNSDSGMYYGLAQYRRILSFTKDDLLRLPDNDVDVVLPFPMPYEPNIHAHHERYLKACDWDAMLKTLKELSPEYYEYFDNVLEQRYLYNYNVIVAKKSVLRAYCEWLFPILERTEELSVPKGKDRADRYIGYMGESLETLYFMKNADKLNIVHTGCRLYV